jgi:hypothetical protein
MIKATLELAERVKIEEVKCYLISTLNTTCKARAVTKANNTGFLESGNWEDCGSRANGAKSL